MSASKQTIKKAFDFIQRGNIEVRYRDGHIEQLTPEELEKRCNFKWQEYFTYQSDDLTDEKLCSLLKKKLIEEYSSTLNKRLNDAEIESMFKTIRTDEEFCTFQRNLLKPSELCLYDMGELGFGLAAKERLAAGRAIIFTGEYQYVELSKDKVAVNNPDYSYTLADFSEPRAGGRYNEGFVYYVNPFQQGGLARFMQNLPESSEYETVPNIVAGGKSPLHYKGINPQDTAVENVFCRCYRIYRNGHMYFVPAVFILNRNLEAGELIGYHYGDVGHWLKLGIKYPELFFKQPRPQAEGFSSHVIPHQLWKRSYAGANESRIMVFSSFGILTEMRERGRFLYYLPSIEQCASLDLRQTLIEANALSAETWGPQQDNTLTEDWRECLKGVDAKVQCYVQDPDILQKLYTEKGKLSQLEDNSTLDIKITFTIKEQFEQFYNALQVEKEKLQNDILKKTIDENKLIATISDETVFVLLLRSVNTFPDLHQTLLNAYRKQVGDNIQWQFFERVPGAASGAVHNPSEAKKLPAAMK